MAKKRKSLFKVEGKNLYVSMEVDKQGNPNLNGQIERINFDVDSRGGLKVVRGFESNNITISENDKISMIYTEDVEFIPVQAYDHFGIDGQLRVPKEFYEIFENSYLKNKYKYVLWDGVVEKVEFYQVCDYESHATNMDYTYYLYKIVL